MSSQADSLLDLILQAGYSEENIQRRLEELRDFMSEETALFFLAKELNLDVGSFSINSGTGEENEIDYDEFRVDISKLTEGMANIVVLGRIKRILPANNFTRKDGTPDIVRSFIIYDNTGECRVVLWGADNVKLSESKFFKINEVVRVISNQCKLNTYNDVKRMELHIGFNGKIVIAPGDVDNSKIPNPIDDFSPKQSEISTEEIVSIAELQKYDGFFNGKIKGEIISIQPILPIKSIKSNETKLLLKFILSDGNFSILVNAWDNISLECAKIISVGDIIELCNFLIKFDEYLQKRVINLHKKSTLHKIN